MKTHLAKAKPRKTGDAKQHQKHHRRITVDVLGVAARLYEAIDTPVSLSCWMLLHYKEFSQLANKEIDARRYRSPSDFFDDYQAVSYLKKYEALPTGIDTRSVALDKFVECERECSETNERFRRYWDGGCENHRVASVFHQAQRKIARILGDVPSFEELDFRFGPGANFGVRGETSVFNKIVADPECTYVMTHKLPEFLEEFPTWFPEGIHDVALRPGSELGFVPKNAKTDRPICIEPLLNGLMQKGIGSYMRWRLRRHGVDLNDQTLNQDLARRAYTDQLSTVDFSSASDMISYNLVLDLLPFDWFELLETCRSPRYLHDGVWRNFHKFSSMGNAYTFELESLIFYALATSACEEAGIRWDNTNVGVYGDDVIIPRDAFSLFREVCSFAGFKINESKTFVDGPFFESCGVDFFRGYLVRPFLQKERVSTFVKVFYVANSIARIAERRSGLPGSRPEVTSALSNLYGWIVHHIPRSLREVGPDGYGDGHLIGEIASSHCADPNGWEGYWFNTFVEQPIKIAVEDWPLAYAVYSAGLATGPASAPKVGTLDLACFARHDFPEGLSLSSGYTVRGRTRIRKVRTFCHGKWQTLGPVFQ